MTAPSETTTETMLPLVCDVTRQLPRGQPVNIAQRLRDEWGRAQLAEQVAGKRIALGFGSRGVAAIHEIAKYLVQLVRESGGEPFIVPAMGSHGGATPAGQIEVLASLGISEATVGCPVRATMETHHVGDTDDGIPAHVGRLAYEADGIILVNRVKPHTDFRGRTESGIVKMLGIGLGKEAGAKTIHQRGVTGLIEDLPRVTQVLLDQLNILCGIITVEDAYHQPVILRALSPHTLFEEEAAALAEARTLMPALPVDDIDVLVVDWLGKEISGTGMDPNIIGRMRIDGIPEPASPQVRFIVVLDVTAASHGNALGIGLADFTTQRLLDKIDFPLMVKNVYTSSFLRRGHIPLVFPDAVQAIDAAVRDVMRAKSIPRDAVRLVHIRDTMHLETVAVSPNLLPEITGRGDFISASEPHPLALATD